MFAQFNYNPVCLALLVGAIFIFAVYPPEASKRPAGIDGTVTDMTGQPVYLKGAARSVMIFAPVAGPYLTVSGTDRHITGLADYIKQEAAETVLGRIFPLLTAKTEAITSIGAVPLNVEQVLLEQPEAVLTWAWFSTGFDIASFKGTVRLNKLGDRLLYEVLGDISGRSSRVVGIWDQYNFQMNQLSDCICEEFEYVTFIVIGNDDLFLWNNNYDEFNKNMLNFKGINLTKDSPFQNGTISLESILYLNPDVVFLDGFTKKLTVDSVFQHPVFRGIKAVAEKRVYRLPSGVSRMEGPVERPILYSWMIQLLHPESNFPVSMRDRIQSTYQEVFGYNLSEDEIDDYLQTSQNYASKYYDMFLRNN
jgi:iron complex transport system substrate-binding protein